MEYKIVIISEAQMEDGKLYAFVGESDFETAEFWKENARHYGLDANELNEWKVAS
jgi:hypothetical protein